MRRAIIAIAAGLSWVAPLCDASAQGTLDKVKARGAVVCGTSQGVPGFSLADASGKWTGFDIDWCRGLAAAIFKDAEKARYVPLSGKDRLTALQSGEIDVLARTTTWTLSRDAGQGLDFTAINYFDGQGFLVKKSLKVATLKDLDGASICVAQGTTTELNLADYFRANRMKYKPVTFQTVDEVIGAYEAGRCDAYTSDMSQLATTRLKMKLPDEHLVLPEIVSKEPLGAWVRQNDSSWFDIVRWTLFAMINAEELGVTQANVKDMLKSDNPEIRRLLGLEGKLGDALGLTSDWVVAIIEAVGNYGESFDRHLGEKSTIKLPRGPNQLWTKGGLQYAPPIR
jgi:general L-amino acid transport system substrate-binding protein